MMNYNITSADETDSFIIKNCKEKILEKLSNQNSEGRNNQTPQFKITQIDIKELKKLTHEFQCFQYF